GRLAAQLGGVAPGLGVDRVDLEATLEGVDDQVAQPVGDSRGVRVDDHQHPPLGARGGEAERLRDAIGPLRGLARGGVDAFVACRGAHALAYTDSRPALPGRANDSSNDAPISLLDCRAHSWTHPEGWRDWPYETPATTSSHRRKVPIPERCVTSPGSSHSDKAIERKGFRM